MRECLEATPPAGALPIAGLVLAAAAAFDLKERRIPNWLTAGAGDVKLSVVLGPCSG